MKKLFTVCFIGMMFLFSSCDSLWMVKETSTVSFEMDLKNILASAGKESSTRSVNSGAVVPNLGDDDTDDLFVVVSLHNALDDSIIDSLPLSVEEAQEVVVGFDSLRQGQNVYAKIEITEKDDDDDEKLFFRARSGATVLKIGVNILQARTNAVFVKPGVDVTGNGYTPSTPVGTLEEAVNILGGASNFMPNATVFVEDTITVSASATWDYPGLIVTNNSANELVKIDVSSDLNSEGVVIKGITFKGNSTIDTDKSLLHLVKGFLSLEDITITGFQTSQDNNSGALLIEEGETYVEFSGNVTITNNTADGKPANVLVPSGYEPHITVMGELTESSRISLNFIESPIADMPVVINEGGAFVKDTFIVTDYRTGSVFDTKIREEDGSLFAIVEAMLPGTVNVVFLNEDGTALNDSHFDIIKVGSGGLDDNYPDWIWGTGAESKTATIDEALWAGSTVSAYLDSAKEVIDNALPEYLIEGTLSGNIFTVTVKDLIEINSDDIDIADIRPSIDGATFGGTWAIVDGMRVDNLTIILGDVIPTYEELFDAIEEAMVFDNTTVTAEPLSISPHVGPVQAGGLYTTVTYTTNKGYIFDGSTTMHKTYLDITVIGETGTIEFYEINASGVKSPLSDDALIDHDNNAETPDIEVSGYLDDVKSFFPEGIWGDNGSEHIVTLNNGFSGYYNSIVDTALEEGYVATATLDANKENTLIVEFVYEGSVVFLDADGNPLDTPEFEDIKPHLVTDNDVAIPGEWGTGDNDHIITIKGKDVKDFVDEYDSSGRNEYEVAAVGTILSITLTDYLNTFVRKIITDTISDEGGTPTYITQKGNVLTVQISKIIAMSEISDPDIAPTGFTTTGTWAIADGNFVTSSSVPTSVTVPNGTTYEEILQAIRAEIDIPNASISDMYYPAGGGGTGVVGNAGSLRILVIIGENPGYAFEGNWAGQITIEFNVALE